MNIYEHNQQAWDLEAASRGQWSSPVPPAVIDAARRGDWEIRLTPNTPIPRAWFPPLANKDVLCLAGGGGQQSPILAATGARVLVLDSSESQLGLDLAVAEANGLSLRAVQGDMANMRVFDAASFDVIVNPCSNCFVPDLRPVWREVHRVLRPGGVLMVGFLNPVYFMFDRRRDEEGVLEVRHALPYSDQATNLNRYTPVYCVTRSVRPCD